MGLPEKSVSQASGLTDVFRGSQILRPKLHLLVTVKVHMNDHSLRTERMLYNTLPLSEMLTMATGWKNFQISSLKYLYHFSCTSGWLLVCGVTVFEVVPLFTLWSFGTNFIQFSLWTIYQLNVDRSTSQPSYWTVEAVFVGSSPGKNHLVPSL